METIQDPHTASLDIRDYLRPIWRRRWLILIVVVAATVLTYRHYASQPKVYAASTNLYFQGSPLDQLLGNPGIAMGDRYTKDESMLITTPAVAQLAAKILHFKGDPNALIGQISAGPEVGSDFVSISSVAGNPKDAGALANAFAQGYVQLQTQKVHQEATSARIADERALTGLSGAAALDMEQKIHTLESIEALPSADVQQLSPAGASSAPISPHPSKNAEFAFFISLLLSIGIAYGLDRLDRRIRRVEDLRAAYGFPVIGEIPRQHKPAPLVEGAPALPDQLREPFRALRTNLQLVSLDRPLKTILITSAIANEGKSTVVRNLALAYRETGLRVAVVECDLRNRTQHHLFAIDPTPGLTDVLTGSETLMDALHDVPVYLPGVRNANTTLALSGARAWHGTGVDMFDDSGTLAVLTSGMVVENPSTVLASDRMRQVLQDIVADFDVVLIDAPGLLTVSDAIPFAPAVDGILLIGSLGKATTVAARRLRDLLERIPGANILGVVANGAPRVAHHYGEPDYGSPE